MTNEINYKIFRDQLIISYHKSFFKAELLNYWVKKFEKWDLIYKVVVGSTASGSLVAAWAIWQTTGGKICWSVISGFASILSIWYTSVKLDKKIKTFRKSEEEINNVKNKFKMLLDDLAARPTSNLQEKYDKKNKYEEEMNAISDAFHSGIFIDQKKGKDLIQKEVDEKFRKWELIE